MNLVRYISNMSEDRSSPVISIVYLDKWKRIEEIPLTIQRVRINAENKLESFRIQVIVALDKFLFYFVNLIAI